MKYFRLAVLLLFLMLASTVFAEGSANATVGSATSTKPASGNAASAVGRARLLNQLGGVEDDLRSLCSGVKVCLDVDYGGCTAEDQKPWAKVKYNDEFCEPFKEITKRGFKADASVPMSAEIYARLGRQYRAIYVNKGTLPLGEAPISYLFDNMPFTAQLINAYLDANYELEYTSPNRRYFRGSNGRSLSGEFYWALQDSAGQRIGMRNVFFGYGHAKVLKWALHGTAIAYLDMDQVGKNEIKYKLTAIVFPANSVLNSIMQMGIFKKVVDEKIDHIVDDIKKASSMYFGGNKEPMLKSAALKSMENVQYVVDFENVVNGAPWQLGDFEKLKKQRESAKTLPVPLQVEEKRN